MINNSLPRTYVIVGPQLKQDLTRDNLHCVETVT